MADQEFEVTFTRTAHKELMDLPQRVADQIEAALLRLVDYYNGIGPAPQIKALTGRAHGYSLRVGNYRALYELDGRRRIIDVYRCGHRKNVHD